MKTALYRLDGDQWRLHPSAEPMEENAASLVLCFASKTILKTPGIHRQVKNKFPAAQIVMCSTAGEIYQDTVLDDTMVVLTVQLEKTKTVSCSVNIKDYDNTYTAAIALARQLPKDDLKYVFL